MTETARILATLKRLLRNRGLTYRDVGRALSLSEPSVKRMFASGRIVLPRLAAIAELAGYSLAELARQAVADEPRLSTLTANQEKELVSDVRLLLVTVCALNHWTAADILSAYRLTEAECVQRLLRLDALGLIELAPGNRIRIRVARDFAWLPGGPIQSYFRREGQEDFLASPFSGRDEEMAFLSAMLTPAGVAELKAEMESLRRKLGALHDQALDIPLAARRGTGLLLAMREWEPPGFAALRRRT
ncbi:MAG: transcriptional regulator [Rhodocyclaceae bacterium]|nr:transcriptional regulator [Rhodocyclaceae bacterium]